MTRLAKPAIAGAVMGLMMLWMLHGQLTGEATAAAPLAFVAAHVVVLVVVLAAGLLGARLSPRARGWMARLHRPGFRHMGAMMGSAFVTAGLVHMLHGGPV